MKNTFRWARVGLAAAAVLLLVYQATLLQVARGAARLGQPQFAEPLIGVSADAAAFVARHRMALGDIDGATNAALLALRSSPLESGAAAVLALATAYRGDTTRAATLLRYAAAGGWRDQFVQWWLLNSAIATGQVDVAAQRADALLRQGVLEDQVVPLLRHLTSTHAGRLAVAPQLANQPAWRTRFLTSLSGLSREQLRHHADLLIAMHSRKEFVARKEAAEVVRHLVDKQEFGRARSVWAVLNGGRRNELVFDSSFDHLGDRPANEAVSPFEWTYKRPLGIATTVELPPVRLSGVALSINVDAGAAGKLVEQTILLNLGDYTLRIAAHAPAGEIHSLLRPTVECVGGPVLPLQPPQVVRDRWIRLAYKLDVPPGCQVQKLAIAITSAIPTSTELWIDDVSIGRR